MKAIGASVSEPSEGASLWQLKELESQQAAEIDGTEEDNSNWRWMEDFGCVIQEVCWALFLSRQVIASATSYFQRTFTIQSKLRYCPWEVAAASVFLAAKVNESPARLRAVITLVEHCRKVSRGGVEPDDHICPTGPGGRPYRVCISPSRSSPSRHSGAKNSSRPKTGLTIDECGVFASIGEFWEKKTSVLEAEEMILITVGFLFGVPRGFMALAELCVATAADSAVSHAALHCLDDVIMCPQLTNYHSPLELAVGSLVYGDIIASETRQASPQEAALQERLSEERWIQMAKLVASTYTRRSRSKSMPVDERLLLPPPEAKWLRDRASFMRSRIAKPSSSGESAAVRSLDPFHQAEEKIHDIVAAVTAYLERRRDVDPLSGLRELAGVSPPSSGASSSVSSSGGDDSNGRRPSTPTKCNEAKKRRRE